MQTFTFFCTETMSAFGHWFEHHMADRDNYASVVTMVFGLGALALQFVLLFFWRVHDRPGKGREVPASACSENYWHIIFIATTACVCSVIAVGIWLESNQAQRMRVRAAATAAAANKTEVKKDK